MFTYEDAQKYDQKHGSPFDRGSADSYYGRPRDPHWYPEGTYKGDRIGKEQMTNEQIQAYLAGYQWNEQFGDKKDWG
jgi:hypothetical protein